MLDISGQNLSQPHSHEEFYEVKIIFTSSLLKMRVYGICNAVA